MTTIRSAYDGKRSRVTFKSSKSALTKQSFKNECNINTILKRWTQSGVEPEGNKNPSFGDFTQLPDYQESLNIVIHAQEAFNSLDANVRKRFQNDPAQVLEFLQDDNNRDEAITLGLIESPLPESEPETPPDSAPEDTGSGGAAG